jgi:hypothetical protein
MLVLVLPHYFCRIFLNKLTVVFFHVPSRNCIFSLKLHVDIKRNELLSHEKTWRKLKHILLSKRSQSEQIMHCMIQL